MSISLIVLVASSILIQFLVSYGLHKSRTLGNRSWTVIRLGAYFLWVGLIFWLGHEDKNVWLVVMLTSIASLLGMVAGNRLWYTRTGSSSIIWSSSPTAHRSRR